MPVDEIQKEPGRWIGDRTGTDIFRLSSQVDALSQMKSSALTRAILRVNFIIPVRGITTLS